MHQQENEENEMKTPPNCQSSFALLRLHNMLIFPEEEFRANLLWA